MPVCCPRILAFGIDNIAGLGGQVFVQKGLHGAVMLDQTEVLTVRLFGGVQAELGGDTASFGFRLVTQRESDRPTANPGSGRRGSRIGPL